MLNNLLKQGLKIEVLLKLNFFDKKTNEDIYFVITEKRLSSKYWYEEQTCPTNFIGVEKIFAYDHETNQMDSDPHGLFSVVGYREVPIDDGLEDQCGSPNPHDYWWEETIKEVKNGKFDRLIFMNWHNQ